MATRTNVCKNQNVRQAFYGLFQKTFFGHNYLVYNGSFRNLAHGFYCRKAMVIDGDQFYLLVLRTIGTKTGVWTLVVQTLVVQKIIMQM